MSRKKLHKTTQSEEGAFRNPMQHSLPHALKLFSETFTLKKEVLRKIAVQIFRVFSHLKKKAKPQDVEKGGRGLNLSFRLSDFRAKNRGFASDRALNGSFLRVKSICCRV